MRLCTNDLVLQKSSGWEACQPLSHEYENWRGGSNVSREVGVNVLWDSPRWTDGRGGMREHFGMDCMTMAGGEEMDEVRRCNRRHPPEGMMEDIYGIVNSIALYRHEGWLCTTTLYGFAY